jgi:hypothetical protein
LPSPPAALLAQVSQPVLGAQQAPDAQWAQAAQQVPDAPLAQVLLEVQVSPAQVAAAQQAPGVPLVAEQVATPERTGVIEERVELGAGFPGAAAEEPGALPE